MDVLRVFYLFYFGAALIKCAPLEKKQTLYDAIAQKCPSVQALPSFKDQKLFHICDDWERISRTNNLTDNTKNDVLCLLYFDSFTQYCTHIKLNTTFTNPNFNVNIKTVCDKLEIIPKHTEQKSNLSKIIITEDDCIRLCEDGYGLVMPICSISYYFSHKVEVTSVKDDTHLIHVPVHEIKTSEISAAQVQTVQEGDVAVTDSKKQANHETEPKVVDVSERVNANERDENLDSQIAKQVPVIVTQKNVQQAGQADVSQVISAPNKTEKKNKTPQQVNNAPNPAVVAPSQPPPQEQPKKDEGNALEDSLLPKNPAQEKVADMNEFTNEQEFERNEEDHQSNNIPMDSEEDVGDMPNFNEKSKIDTNKPHQTDETEAANYTTEMDGDSYFFTYFMLLCVIFIVGYVCYHNKQKILALILEGRKGKRQYRGRRPNSANYHKLDSNLEEAITSSCNKNTNNVIY